MLSLVFSQTESKSQHLKKFIYTALFSLITQYNFLLFSIDIPFLSSVFRRLVSFCASEISNRYDHKFNFKNTVLISIFQVWSIDGKVYKYNLIACYAICVQEEVKSACGCHMGFYVPNGTYTNLSVTPYCLDLKEPFELILNRTQCMIKTVEYSYENCVNCNPLCREYKFPSHFLQSGQDGLNKCHFIRSISRALILKTNFQYTNA